MRDQGALRPELAGMFLGVETLVIGLITMAVLRLWNARRRAADQPSATDGGRRQPKDDRL